MIRIDHSLLSELNTQASRASRKRMNHNFHNDGSDTLQRMLNAIEPGSYVRPHKHDTPDKREAFIILKGKMAVFEFDDAGNVTDSIILDSQKGNYGIEIKPKTWHTIVSLEVDSVVYEVKDGPYDVIDDKNFAKWAPKEGDDDCGDYIKKLIQHLHV